MQNYIYALIVLIVLSIIHFWGLDGAYVRYQWLDIVTHGLVCFGIGISIAAFIVNRSWKHLNKPWIIALLTLVVGIAWEWLEAVYDITGYPVGTKMYYLDTTKDLIIDFIFGYFGARLAIWLAKNK